MVNAYDASTQAAAGERKQQRISISIKSTTQGRRLKQEDQKFKDSLSYTVSLKPLKLQGYKKK